MTRRGEISRQVDESREKSRKWITKVTIRFQRRDISKSHSSPVAFHLTTCPAMTNSSIYLSYVNAQRVHLRD